MEDMELKHRLDQIDKKLDLAILLLDKQMAWNDRYDRDNFKDDVFANIAGDILFESIFNPNDFFDIERT